MAFHRTTGNRKGQAAMIEPEPLNARPPEPEDDDDQLYRLVVEHPETVPGAAELVDEGFVALGRLTGGTWFVEVWPEEHRRALPETRSVLLADNANAKVWFVRSPWPSISPTHVVSLVYASQTRTPGMRLDEARAILQLDEVEAGRQLQARGLLD
jgi:hypothetical protein